MNKKGQSISINTIIIAAIALAVLVVLFVIFTGRLGIFSKGVSETASCENACKALGRSGSVYKIESKPACEVNKDANRIYIAGTYDDVKPSVCCCEQ